MRGAVFATAVLLVAGVACAQEPPNRQDISPRLATSGQPTKAFLGTLREQGFQAVVYLAPPTVGDAVAEEDLVVGRQGLLYVNIPIDFMKPTAADFEAVSRILRALEGRKVFVHCQANFRASSMVFLYRVIHGREDPEKAWEAVAGVWKPNATWSAFIRETLRAHQVAFEPL